MAFASLARTVVPGAVALVCSLAVFRATTPARAGSPPHAAPDHWRPGDKPVVQIIPSAMAYKRGHMFLPSLGGPITITHSHDGTLYESDKGMEWDTADGSRVIIRGGAIFVPESRTGGKTPLHKQALR